MKTILYLSRITERTSKGIINKVNYTVKALKEEGCDAKSVIFHEHARRGSMKVVLKLLQSKEDLIIIRSCHYTMLIILLPMLYARIRGQKIIIDVPTPVAIATSEVEGYTSSFFMKKLRKLLLYITFPLSFYPANRILEYSHESNWFSFGVKKKIKLVGNGILVKSVPYRKLKPLFDQKNLNLLGVAHLAYWHGYDRLIYSIDSYNKINRTNPKKVQINLWIIGDGAEKSNLEKVVKNLSLENQIKFTGMKEGNELAKYFENVHLGVCSLALYRKNLFFASELKARDYAARGLPFILASDDYDFQEKLPFVYRCENNDTLIDMDEIIKWYTSLDYEYDDFSFIRDFAVDRLDYASKVRKDILSVFE